MDKNELALEIVKAACSMGGDAALPHRVDQVIEAYKYAMEAVLKDPVITPPPEPPYYS